MDFLSWTVHHLLSLTFNAFPLGLVCSNIVVIKYTYIFYIGVNVALKQKIFPDEELVCGINFNLVQVDNSDFGIIFVFRFVSCPLFTPGMLCELGYITSLATSWAGYKSVYKVVKRLNLSLRIFKWLRWCCKRCLEGSWWLSEQVLTG